MCIISSIIFDENLIVDSVTESDAEFQIHFELNDEFVAKHRPEGARLHETRIIAVKDLPLYSNRDGRSKGVVLFIPTIRYKDPVTGKTVTWRPAFIDSRRAITRRLRSEIVRAYDLPDSEIASRLKLSEGTVRLVRKDHYEGLDARTGRWRGPASGSTSAISAARLLACRATLASAVSA